MNSIQRAVFPAILISSLVLVGITRLIASPQLTVIAATEPPMAAEPAQNEAVVATVEVSAEIQPSLRSWRLLNSPPGTRMNVPYLHAIRIASASGAGGSSATPRRSNWIRA